MSTAARRRCQRVLCLCGAPASGKSTAASLLSRKGVVVIESGLVVARLLGSRNVHELPLQEQKQFRREAVALVTGPGATPLVRTLRRQIRTATVPVILVGIRNASTIEGLLRSRSLALHVVFLHAPLRLRVRRYQAREGERALVYADLLRSRTEGEHAAIARMADERIDNGADLRTLRRALASAAHWLLGEG
jgi:dephospho-CoA kinase